jgi:signal transduction histidine kinase
MKTLIRARWTVRVRLTALHAALFLVAGTLLLGVTYLLVQQSLDHRDGLLSRRTSMIKAASLPADLRVELQDGRWVNPQQFVGEVEAEQHRQHEHLLESFLTRGAMALGGVGIIAAALGWMLAGRALRPVHRITDTARRIAGADGAGRGLHERIALHGPADEVKELADTFDVMLERLDGSFDGQRRFVASASHEMRTPLAIKRALIEVAITRPGASRDARELGESLLEINARHERLVDGLLTLADSENRPAEVRPVDLSDVAASVIEDAATPAGKARVDLRPPDLASAPTTGDPYLVERLVHNLVENAIRHNHPDGGWLSVRTWQADGRAMLRVTNSGPVIRDYETETLFQPFRRLRDRRAAARPGADRGFGLGLSIVRAIATAHGGTAHAEPHQGGGLVVTVALPQAPPP